MSKLYSRIKKWYEDGLWSVQKVREAVEGGWITPEEFYEITGEVYLVG